MKDCCSDYVVPDIALECNSHHVRRRVPFFILSNGNVYDEELSYMCNGKLEGNMITVNPLAEPPTFSQYVEERNIIQKALGKKGRKANRE